MRNRRGQGSLDVVNDKEVELQEGAITVSASREANLGSWPACHVISDSLMAFWKERRAIHGCPPCDDFGFQFAGA